MFETFRNAWKTEDLRKRLLYTLLILILFRLGCAIPVPYITSSALESMFTTGSMLTYLNMMSGGAMSRCTIFALGVQPYINATIIIQLLCVAIPYLENLSKEGEEGRQKLTKISNYTGAAIALLLSIAYYFIIRRMGALKYTDGFAGIFSGIVIVACFTAGAQFVTWMGNQIDAKGIGNGLSLMIFAGIVADWSRVGSSFQDMLTRAQAGASGYYIMIPAMVILALVAVVFVVILTNAERRIPVQYSKKMQGRRMIGGQSSHIPLKVNTAGVIPVIFASSIMSMPVMIAQFFNVDYSTFGGKILMALSSANWFRPEMPVYSVGLLIYIVLVVLFAYFYTSITFNPLEVANNMKKSGGFIPGVRPGKPTSDFLNNILNYIVFIGATGLVIVCIVPIIASGLFNVGSLSFGGTSLIIIAGVILETIKAVDSMMLVRNYKGFLND